MIRSTIGGKDLCQCHTRRPDPARGSTDRDCLSQPPGSPASPRCGYPTPSFAGVCVVRIVSVRRRSRKMPTIVNLCSSKKHNLRRTESCVSGTWSLRTLWMPGANEECIRRRWSTQTSRRTRLLQEHKTVAAKAVIQAMIIRSAKWPMTYRMEDHLRLSLPRKQGRSRNQ